MNWIFSTVKIYDFHNGKGEVNRFSGTAHKDPKVPRLSLGNSGIQLPRSQAFTKFNCDHFRKWQTFDVGAPVLLRSCEWPQTERLGRTEDGQDLKDWSHFIIIIIAFSGCLLKRVGMGTSLVIQWLRFQLRFNAEDLYSIPGQRPKIPPAVGQPSPRTKIREACSANQ